MVKVSVIIPNYNHAKYLPQRIESVLQQTFTDFEVIILDDCSTDTSRTTINQYATHPKVTHVIFNEHNSGSTFIQWKKGFDLTQGKYIWIAESDDVAAPDFLKSLVGSLDQDEQTSIAYCPSYWIDESDQIIMTPALGKQEYLEGKCFIQQYFLIGNAIPNASMAIFRKEALEKVDFSKIITLKYCGDWLFWACLLNGSRIYRHHQALNYYRRHSESVSTFSDKIGLFFIEGLKVVWEVNKLLAIDVKQYVRISKLWGYKLFEYRKKNKTINAPIFSAFVKYLPAGLIFFVLYSIKYHKRPVQH